MLATGTVAVPILPDLTIQKKIKTFADKIIRPQTKIKEIAILSPVFTRKILMSEAIVKQWLENAVTTATKKDHVAHMSFISKKVSLQGVPGYENIGYNDWAAQTLHEFENNIIKSVHYKKLKLVTTTSTHIMFKTFETVEANDGTINAQGIEILLEKESDGEWRMVQERILPEDEARHDGLID